MVQPGGMDAPGFFPVSVTPGSIAASSAKVGMEAVTPSKLAVALLLRDYIHFVLRVGPPTPSSPLPLMRLDGTIVPRPSTTSSAVPITTSAPPSVLPVLPHHAVPKPSQETMVLTTAEEDMPRPPPPSQHHRRNPEDDDDFDFEEEEEEEADEDCEEEEDLVDETNDVSADTPAPSGIGARGGRGSRAAGVLPIYPPPPPLPDVAGDEEMEEFACRKVTAQQRKSFCLLALRLIQGTDCSLSYLSALLLDPRHALPLRLLAAWRRHLAYTLREDVGGVMDLAKSLEELVNETVIPLLTKASVVGLFLRRLVLCFNRLSFHEVANLSSNFRSYIARAEAVVAGSGGDDGVAAVGIGTIPENPADGETTRDLANSRKGREGLAKDSFLDDSVVARVNQGDGDSEVQYTKKQAELYIATQVDLLQHDESSADPPAAVESNTGRIVGGCPELASEAHFLDFLNCLRVRDFSGAASAVNLGVNPEVAARRATVANQPDLSRSNAVGTAAEEANKGFRYASLTLASLHARFGHRGPALFSLKESLMMAQEADDHTCLLHALMWLLRIDCDTDTNLSRIINNFSSHSYSAKVRYLEGLAHVGRSQFDVLHGYSPQRVVGSLVYVDLLAGAASNTELLAASLAQRSAIWSLYGRADLCGVLAQLVLRTDQQPGAAGGRGGKGVANRYHASGEGVVLALCLLAGRLFDAGKGRACDKVLKLASSLYCNSSTQHGTHWRQCAVKVAFLRALRRTDWIDAARRISEMAAIEQTGAVGGGEGAGLAQGRGAGADGSGESDFMRLQLALWRGHAAEMEAQLKRMPEPTPPTPMASGADDLSANDGAGGGGGRSPVYCARKLLFEVEWRCLCGNYVGAIQPLLSCLQVCADFNLEFLETVARLHSAHLQLHLRMPEDAILVLRRVLPTLLSQGDRFEAGRAHLLMAKCLVARCTMAEDDGSGRRLDVISAASHLKKADSCFRAAGAFGRVKDVLYMMARLYHSLEMAEERNGASAEFKKLEEQNPTNVCSRLPQML